MDSIKINKVTEFGKSFIVGIVPITIIRMVLQLNFQITNAFISSMVMIGLIGLIYILRIKAKWSENNDLPIFILTIVFFPAGIYYLWKYSHRTEAIKVIVTILIIGLLVLGKFIAG